MAQEVKGGTTSRWTPQDCADAVAALEKRWGRRGYKYRRELINEFARIKKMTDEQLVALRESMGPQRAMEHMAERALRALARRRITDDLAHIAEFWEP